MVQSVEVTETTQGTIHSRDAVMETGRLKALGGIEVKEGSLVLFDFK